jgi:glycosyltransferase involved in cell wall biosynthesis
MKIVFFVPRVHPNMEGWLDGVRTSGMKLRIAVLFASTLNDVAREESTVVGYSRLWKGLFGRKGLNQYDDFSMHYGLPSVRGLIRFFRANRDASVVIIRNISTVSGLFALLAARCFTRAQIIAYSQTPRRGKKMRFIRRLWRDFLHGGLNVRGMTPKEGDLSLPLLHEKIDYVPFCRAAMTDGIPAERTVPYPVRILEIGKFIPYKNHLTLIEALGLLRDEIDFRAVIAGECTQPEQKAHLEFLKERVRELGLENRVSFEANLPRDKVYDLMKRSHLFVLCGSNELAPFSNLEAMSFALPVIYSHNNGTAEYMRKGVSGDLFVDKDVNSLAECLRKWLADPEKLRAAGLAALEDCKRYHSISLMPEYLRRVAGKENA